MATYAKVTSVHEHTQKQSASRGTESLGWEIERSLRASSHNGLRGIRCEHANGRVTLEGEVATYYLKQLAQSIVGRVEGVKTINNRLQVTDSGSNPWAN